MEAHRLDIGDLEARCTALAGPSAAARMGAALDRALAHGLPQALAREAEPVLDGLDGVVRIRELSVRLDLGARFDESGIVNALAARLAAALRAALARGEPDLRVWPDHASYLASYILMRLGLAPGPDWPFADLGKLSHLPAERAAAELIQARPAILAPLAREAARIGAAEAPVQDWPEAAQAALMRALLGEAPEAAERAALAAALRVTTAFLPVHRPASGQAALAAALPLVFRALVASPAAPAPRAMAFAAAALMGALPRRQPEPLAGRPTDAAAAASPTADPDEAAMADARQRLRREPRARAQLAEILARQEARRERATQGAEREETPRDCVGAAAQSAPRTPFAGLGLLWPSALATGAPEALGPTGLAMAVWQALDPTDWEAAAEDPALALLFPVDPREIDLARPQPEPPPAQALRVDAAARPAVEAAPEGRGWTALILGDFASRLRGLRGSSHGWLCTQFLRSPGHVEAGEQAITVHLDPIPLAIVLQMAGLDGPQMRLPEPRGRRFVLDLGGRG